MIRELYPVEITTHNLHFHDEASVFTVDYNGRYLATGGGDKEIRLWTVEKRACKDREVCHTTALNTTIKISYHSVLTGHQRTVNCVRFNGDLLASCSDGGQVIVWENGNPMVIRGMDGDDAYELAWGRDHLFVGLASGNIGVYKIEHVEEEEPLKEDTSDLPVEQQGRAKKRIVPTVLETEGASTHRSRRIVATLVQQVRGHSDVIQGMAYNRKYDLLTSLGKDRVGMTFLFNGELVQIEKMEYMNKDRVFAVGKGFFRRLSYSDDGDFLYLVCCASNTVVVLHYPFRIEHVYATIGPLNSEPVKVMLSGPILYIATKKSLYVFREREVLFCVDNICFMSATDGCMVDGVCFLSSLDGFLASLRIK
jgi:chromatin assembly factor 1 subunit B